MQKIKITLTSLAWLGGLWGVLILTQGFLGYTGIQSAHAEETVLDQSLKPPEPPNPVPPIMRDMGVVQKKAMDKANKFLFSNYWSMDFSDGPFTMYGVNFDIGYAISDFWEVYFNTTPFYITQARSIVSTVQQLQLANGQSATITGSKAQHEYGAELLWIPLYGKDSLGIRTIVRSDTFIKLGVSQVTFDSGTGMRFQAGGGKTFFLGAREGVRLTVSANYTQTVVNGIQAYKMIPVIEAGYVLYLF